MSLKYELVEKRNPLLSETPKKYFASPVRPGDIALRELATEIAEISTVSIVDTMAVIESLLQLIPRHVTKGETVKLGDFGSYSVNIKSDGADSKETFTTNNITGVKLNFQPGKTLKNALKNVTFEKA